MSMASILALQTMGAGGWLGFAPLIFIFAIFYFLLIMPQQRRQKKWQQMLNDLKTGDKVVTSGGLRGTVIALRDDYIQLRVPPDNLRLEVTRASVASVVDAGGQEQQGGMSSAGVPPAVGASRPPHRAGRRPALPRTKATEKKLTLRP